LFKGESQGVMYRWGGERGEGEGGRGGEEGGKEGGEGRREGRKQEKHR
jgi:hypothetical protein